MNQNLRGLCRGQVVDARGLHCPEPLMLLKLETDKAGPHQWVSLVSDDPNALNNVKEFCDRKGYTMTWANEGSIVVYNVLRFPGAPGGASE